ncbi:serine protease Do [Methylobacillus rhizosphaerae]|uniref:Probable periplasmic serine endoprotease DegP-like n=1 Tax=Methylobacillus rhizosphaerae TaxID=551994 RepID=A0A238YZI6_9PROT|nr:DegQ family serine endoprotease [Methylobacillus rhizosphaerae]SNR76422.1 serine protease Do [Methylobacillus rhizosphaerae]
MVKKLIAVSAICLSLGLSVATPVLAKELPDFTELAEKQGDAVVNISVTQVVQAGSGSPFQGMPDDEALSEFFRRFGIPGFPGGPRGPGNSQQPEYKSQSLGSGFIISNDGYILTNAHVVREADEVIVKLNDKREFKAKIIGADRRTDVALLKIDATGLPKVVIGNPEQLRVGEWVVAIGSPFGLESTLTAGVVSAKGRALPQENFVPFIQTDVAINPGNSGGPLFNLKGEVVGVNSQIYSRTGGYMGLSFSIPIDVAIEVSNQLKVSGRVARGWLGIGIQEMTKDLADSFGMKNTEGALVAGVEKGSPAEKGGLEPGDVVTKFDGKPVVASADLPRIVGATKPGKQVPVEVLRKGSNKVLHIALGEMPVDKDEVSTSAPSSTKSEDNRLGLTLREVSPQQRRDLNGRNAFVVVDAQGSAAQAGIRRGDLILALNNTEVQSLEQFAKQVNAVPAGKTVALLVQRGDNTLYVPVKIGK